MSDGCAIRRDEHVLLSLAVDDVDAMLGGLAKEAVLVPKRDDADPQGRFA